MALKFFNTIAFIPLFLMAFAFYHTIFFIIKKVAVMGLESKKKPYEADILNILEIIKWFLVVVGFVLFFIFFFTDFGTTLLAPSKTF
ncbi:hypothetical protein AAEX37_01802 [Oligella sp. MSHR50489EDL]|uniref:hypothetical protein n=1 Tax=Oligella sp. MSHR50489EDL TaxID=3139409 RepID=UPI003D8155E4